MREKMLESKAMIKETEMGGKMQSQAMAYASLALDLYDVYDCFSIASQIKKEFDKKYGRGWQYVVDSNFGCFYSHTRDFCLFCFGDPQFPYLQGSIFMESL